ncbi:hypothetical protein [Halobacillus sp. Marseille-Q1614]|uniref:hypothetical protein n=1 Tax=Halobacillus sp. Marseille-Q1614 TaxID=2709134 RepID=UPI00156E4E18|nr:hypothetical protein [Halobacillus sp. Marseille-Q1614]
MQEKQSTIKGGRVLGIYRTVCYKVEDLFIRMMSRNQNSEEIKQKVIDYRNQKEMDKRRKRQELKANQDKKLKINEQKRADKEA